ncbi:hypothetical protein NPL7_00985 [Metamycoplasma hyosynoviae]|uniref:histidine triad protein HinT n=1 Tax=Metamycoplasma hyosynoviae TaxID=29559 RepID=UPI000460D061|nr:HIT domain-containing protein [Metamycoplasma hyosynoviae]KDE42104.1 hypothetical protein NPL3_01715 [Metamycoplasma hyosynoviae]KDE42289.1 hypothetical protein NPL7_00985 [Metamycoplasma hyosynoviae]KDE44105.1 hypothetical protein NPL5_00105 [Metamycoplasma hyosynoviae]KDE44184.1 hypothetical protein NPL6_02470 [Metamycoplasma hyosynoviae]KDE44865.1 hypothetical protein NPL4_02780 [Metamycoplasma hyosynoviae]
MEKDTFQRIIDREIPATILYEDDDVIAFLDINPINKGHFLVVPKEYSENLFDIEDEHYVKLMQLTKKLALSQVKKLNAKGFKLESNNGEAAGQEIPRTHIHVIPYYEEE